MKESIRYEAATHQEASEASTVAGRATTGLLTKIVKILSLRQGPGEERPLITEIIN
jgi:hypothetical protein